MFQKKALISYKIIIIIIIHSLINTRYIFTYFIKMILKVENSNDIFESNETLYIKSHNRSIMQNNSTYSKHILPFFANNSSNLSIAPAHAATTLIRNHNLNNNIRMSYFDSLYFIAVTISTVFKIQKKYIYKIEHSNLLFLILIHKL